MPERWTLGSTVKVGSHSDSTIEVLLLRESIKSFLFEDLGSGDITSSALFDAKHHSRADFIAKEPLLAVGIESVAAQVFAVVNPKIICKPLVADGQKVAPGEIMMKVEGSTLDLLRGERVALNLIQRLSGIASLTANFVKQVAGLPVRLVDTRKTTPGLRMLEKYAVRVGGGHNHRFSLSDGILIKENHIEAAGSITAAIEKIREVAPHTLRIEIEVETLDQLEECLDCRADIILLDNMTVSTMREAVKITHGKAILEASGGVNIDNVRKIAMTGVDLISIGALTHSATARDISLRFTGINAN